MKSRTKHSRYVIEPLAGSFYVFYEAGNGDAISGHSTEKLAKDAVKRYEAGDLRRGTHRRSGADIINDLTHK